MSNQIKVEVSAVDKTRWVVKKIQSDLNWLWWKLWASLRNWLSWISWLWAKIWSWLSSWLSTALQWVQNWLIWIWVAWTTWMWLLINDTIQADKTFRQLKNQIGWTDAEMNILKDSIKATFAQWLWTNLEDVSKIFWTIKRETKLSWKELETLSKNILTIWDTFWQDYNRVFFSINRLMSEFWISWTEASNLVMKWLQTTWDTADDFLQTVWEYAANFNEWWYAAKDFFNFLINCNKKGAKDFDWTADVAREFFSLLKDWTTEQQAMIDELGINYKDFREWINNWSVTQKDAMLRISTAIATVWRDLDASKISATLFWAKIDDVWVEFVKNLRNAKDEMWNVNWVVDTATKNISNNFENVFRRMRLSFMKIWEAFLPFIQQFSNWIDNNQPKIDEFAKSVAKFIWEFDFNWMINSLIKWINLISNLVVALKPVYDIFKKIYNTAKEIINLVDVILSWWWKSWVAEVIWKMQEIDLTWAIDKQFNISRWFWELFQWNWLKWFTDKWYWLNSDSYIQAKDKIKWFMDVWAFDIEKARNVKNNTTNVWWQTININMNNNVIKDQADEKRTAQTISETIAKQNQNFILWIN